MKFSRALSFFCICISIALSPFLGLAQSIPVPEYYGVYVVANGQLVRLNSNPVHATQYVTVPFGLQNSVGNILHGQPAALSAAMVRIPVFPANLQIIIYQQPSGIESSEDVANSIHLVPLVFVKRLSVDTGFPNHVRRSGVENGWAEGNAAGTPGGRKQDLQLLVKPMPDHPGMVVAGLEQKLAPGVYRIREGQEDAIDAMMGGSKGLAFAVEPIGQGETQTCTNESVTYMMMMSKVAYSSCAGSFPQGMAGGPSAEMSNGAAACSDYGSCFKQGLSAFEASSWDEAIRDFREATRKDATKGNAWAWLGRAYLGAGDTTDFSAAWDKALSIGFPLSLGVCHEKGLFGGNCARGELTITNSRILFGKIGQAPLFTVPAKDIRPRGTLHLPIKTNQGFSPAFFRISVGKKNYNFDFIPYGVKCQINSSEVMCPPAGTIQQMAVGKYVMQVIPKIASGRFTAKASPTQPPSAPQTTSKGGSLCAQAKLLPYSILANGGLYKAKYIGPVGPHEQLFFFNEKGSQVTDPKLTLQLATSVWTYDNVVASPAAREAANQVKAVLSTSKAIQQYSNTQDLLARSSVEALEAVATDGVSLTKAIPNLTIAELRRQLLSSPKALLTLIAQEGLHESLAKYQEMDERMPPQDSSAVSAADLIRLEKLYLQARTLQLPNEALAAKLMPTKGSDLTTAALKSAVGEILAGPIFKQSENTAITLHTLLAFQEAFKNAVTTAPALKVYSQNLNLALNLTKANDATISRWANESEHTCAVGGK